MLGRTFCGILRACSLVGAGTDLDWLVLVFCERKTLLAGWFGLAETNERTGCKPPQGRSGGMVDI